MHQQYRRRVQPTRRCISTFDEALKPHDNASVLPTKHSNIKTTHQHFRRGIKTSRQRISSFDEALKPHDNASVLSMKHSNIKTMHQHFRRGIKTSRQRISTFDEAFISIHTTCTYFHTTNNYTIELESSRRHVAVPTSHTTERTVPYSAV